MSTRRVLALGLVLLALAMESWAYYGARGVMPIAATSFGHTPSSISSMYTVMTWVAAFFGLGGAGLALVLRPRLVAAIGVAVLALGLVLFGIGAPPMLSAAIVGIGYGVFRPCLWASIPDVVLADEERLDLAPSPSRFAQVAGVATIFYVANNFAAMTGPMVVGAASRSSGFRLAFFGGAFLCFLSAIVLAIAAFLRTPRASSHVPDASPYRGAPTAPAPYGGPKPNPVAALIAIGAIAVEYGVGAVASISVYTSELARGGMSRFSLSVVETINPGAVMVVGFFVLIVWTLATYDRWSMAPMLLAGAGLAIVGLGYLLEAIAPNSVVLGLGELGTGAGEAVAMPVLYMYTLLAVPPRHAALAAAAWSFATALVSAIAAPLGGIHGVGTVLGILGGLVLLGGGIGLAVASRRVHRMFDPPATPA